MENESLFQEISLLRLCLIFCLILVAPLASGAGVIDIDKEEGLSIGRKTYFVKGDFSFDQVSREEFAPRFKKGNQEILIFGTDFSVHWLRLSLGNSSAGDREIFLTTRPNTVDRLEFYTEDGRIGVLRKANTLRSRYIRLHLPAYSVTDLYVKRETRYPTGLDWRIWLSETRMQEDFARNEVEIAVMLTLLVTSLFLNLVLYISFRSKTYLHYMFYLGFFGLLAVSYYNIGYVPVVWDHCITFISCLMAVFATLFAIEFLELRQAHPISYHFLRCLAWMEALFGFGTVFFPDLTVVNIVLVSVGTPMIMLSGIRVAMQGKSHAIIFCVAFGLMLASSFVMLLVWSGYWGGVTYRFMLYGATLENLLMLIAIGEKLSMAERGRRIASRHRVALQQELRTQNQLAMAGRMLAHDVRRPFEILRLVFDQLRSNPGLVQGELAGLEKSMRSAEERVTHMIKDLVDLNPDQQGELFVVSLNGLVRRLLENRPDLSRPVSYHPTHLRKVVAEENRMLRVLDNLLDNAVEAAPVGTGVDISTREVQVREGFVIVVSVTNSLRSGLRPDLQRIFEPWYTSGKRQGTGLGLAIVKKLVEETGGTITCRFDDDGLSLSFDLTLKVAWGEDEDVRLDTFDYAPQAGPVAPPRRPVRKGLPDFHQLEGPVVMVIEDEEVFLELWEKRLTADGAEVLAFSHPRMARKALTDAGWDAGRIDYIVTDYYFASRSIISTGFLPWIYNQGFRGEVFLASSGVDFPDLPGYVRVIPKAPCGLDGLEEQLAGDRAG